MKYFATNITWDVPLKEIVDSCNLKDYVGKISELLNIPFKELKQMDRYEREIALNKTLSDIEVEERYKLKANIFDLPSIVEVPYEVANENKDPEENARAMYDWLVETFKFGIIAFDIDRLMLDDKDVEEMMKIYGCKKDCLSCNHSYSDDYDNLHCEKKNEEIVDENYYCENYI